LIKAFVIADAQTNASKWLVADSSLLYPTSSTFCPPLLFTFQNLRGDLPASSNHPPDPL